MMCNGGTCCGYCEPEEHEFTSEDRKALLKEQAAILEAKLATVKQRMENLDKEESKNK